jgi:PII-like signaling protein
MIVEIVDSKEKIDSFLGAIEPMIGSGLVTLEKATVIRYGEGKPPGR